MNTYWSCCVQQTEELYLSRALRFHSGNMDRWIEAMRLQDGMDILEVGCAGGLLCHRLKECLPGAALTGLDLDTGHIEYARHKAKELNLACSFVEGDATALPFNSCSFDACCSYTVIHFCDPVKFIGEQHRVLRPGGRMIILCLMGAGGGPEEWVPAEGCEEKELFDKLWAAAEKNPCSQVRRYEGRMERYAELLDRQGFHSIGIDALAVVKYAPDFENTPREMARAQINEDRVSELCSVKKARYMAPDALTDAEFGLLQEMIDRRYDQKLRQYENGEKDWSMRIATTVLISGVK